jgi:hypothetical protein
MLSDIFHLQRRKSRPDFMGIAKEEPRFWDPIVYAHTGMAPCFVSLFNSVIV